MKKLKILYLSNRFHSNVCSIGLMNYRQLEELYNELNSNNFIDI